MKKKNRQPRRRQPLPAASPSAQLGEASTPPVSTPPAVEPFARPQVIAQLATGLWRLRQKMVSPGTDEPLPEVAKLFRHLDSTWDVVVQAGVQIQHHTGARFESGLGLSVLAYQPTPDLTHEIVVETVKPSVYYQGRLIQMGEVIVGTPTEVASASPQPAPGTGTLAQLQDKLAATHERFPKGG